MSQQIPMVNGRAYQNSDNYVRRLFMETGYGWVEIANSLGKPIVDGVTWEDDKIPRIVEDYTPPSPSAKNTEIKLASGQSIIHGTGKSSYKADLRLLFPDSLSYSDFVFYMGNRFKYYDERGSIFLGVISEQPTINRVEAGQRYDVKVPFLLVKKSTSEDAEECPFTDLTTDAVYTVTFTDYGDYLLKDQMVKLTFTGLNTYVYLTVPIIGTPNPFTSGSITNTPADMVGINDVVKGNSEGFTAPQLMTQQLKDAGYEDYFGIDYKYNEIILSPKLSKYSGVTFDPLTTTVKATVATSGGKHYAYEHIAEMANAGLVATQDGKGNYIYTFSPNARATRAECATMIDNTRKWIDRMLRG